MHKNRRTRSSIENGQRIPLMDKADSWTVAEAKAKFSEVLKKAQAGGPQIITKNGRRAAVVVAVHEWERKSKRKGNLAEFFAASPLRGSNLKIPRIRGGPGKINL
jgi:prevent-host-death family protein